MLRVNGTKRLKYFEVFVGGSVPNANANQSAVLKKLSTDLKTRYNDRKRRDNFLRILQ